MLMIPDEPERKGPSTYLEMSAFKRTPGASRTSRDVRKVPQNRKCQPRSSAAASKLKRLPTSTSQLLGYSDYRVGRREFGFLRNHLDKICNLHIMLPEVNHENFRIFRSSA
jgi:hypothetical protein